MPKHASRPGLTIHLKKEELAEIDLEIAEHLKAAPAAKLTRGPMVEWILRQHLATRRAARGAEQAPAPSEAKGRKGGGR